MPKLDVLQRPIGKYQTEHESNHTKRNIALAVAIPAAAVVGGFLGLKALSGDSPSVTAEQTAKALNPPKKNVQVMENPGQYKDAAKEKMDAKYGSTIPSANDLKSKQEELYLGFTKDEVKNALITATKSRPRFKILSIRKPKNKDLLELINDGPFKRMYGHLNKNDQIKKYLEIYGYKEKNIIRVFSSYRIKYLLVKKDGKLKQISNY